MSRKYLRLRSAPVSAALDAEAALDPGSEDVEDSTTASSEPSEETELFKLPLPNPQDMEEGPSDLPQTQGLQERAYSCEDSY